MEYSWSGVQLDRSVSSLSQFATQDHQSGCFPHATHIYKEPGARRLEATTVDDFSCDVADGSSKSDSAETGTACTVATSFQFSHPIAAEYLR